MPLLETVCTAPKILARTKNLAPHPLISPLIIKRGKEIPKLPWSYDWGCDSNPAAHIWGLGGGGVGTVPVKKEIP